MLRFFFGEKEEFKLEEVKFQGIDLVKQYPIEELYRLIVDGCFHSSQMGWVKYEERQPGCLKAAFNALGFAISDLSKHELTEVFILKLHEICIPKDDKTSPGKVRNESKRTECFGINGSNMSEAGLLEILNNMEKEEKLFEKFPLEYGTGITYKDSNNKINFELPAMIWQISLSKAKTLYNVETNAALAKKLFANIESRKYKYFFIAPSAGNITATFKQLIQDYNIQIAEAKKPEQKLNIIVKHITALNRLHPFKDGNIRVFVIFLMNRLLLQNGFPLATHLNPNVFDGFSQAELMIKVKEAMKKTMDIIKGEKNSFNFKSDKIPEKYQKIYSEMYKGFIQQLSLEKTKKITP